MPFKAQKLKSKIIVVHCIFNIGSLIIFIITFQLDMYVSKSLSAKKNRFRVSNLPKAMIERPRTRVKTPGVETLQSKAHAVTGFTDERSYNNCVHLRCHTHRTIKN